MASSRKPWFRSQAERDTARGSSSSFTAARLLRGRTQRTQRQPLRAGNIVDLRKMTTSDGTRSRKARRAQDREANMRQRRRARQAKSSHKGFQYESSLASKIVPRSALRYDKERPVKATQKRLQRSKKTRQTSGVSSWWQRLSQRTSQKQQEHGAKKKRSPQKEVQTASQTVKASSRQLKDRSVAWISAFWSLIRKPVLITGSIGSALTLIIIVGFSPLFRVERVVLEGNTQLQQSELNQAVEEKLVVPRWWQAPSRSVLGWSHAAVAQAVESIHPESASITIERTLPNVMIVHVEDKVPAAIWRTSNGLFMLDEEGYACCKALLSDWADANVPRVTDRSAREASVNQQVTKPRHMQALQAIEHGIRANVPIITIDRYEFPAAQAEEVHVITDEGVTILFSLGIPIEDQIEKLRITLAQEVGDQYTSLEYIDLRVSEYAYYR